MLDNDKYAGKKRKKPVQKQKTMAVVTKSNPSKRHRDRLNGELDRLTNMLPFPENVLTRLDKLSVLRLSVGYLKVKSFFNATMKKNGADLQPGKDLDTSKKKDLGVSEGELLLQALNGFVLVVTAAGYVFYASSTIHDYLGFHQSDMVHQSVFEFIHVDDRAMFRRQLHFALTTNLSDGEAEVAQNSSETTRNVVSFAPQHIPPENSSFLERSFVCRFRCLLDNSSGFLKLNFQGRLKFLLGQNRKAEDGSLVQPQLALFAIATPVQPSAILEIRTKTLIFQTKHKLDFTPLGIDSRGKVVLGYTEIELCSKGSGYQFIHAADMMHCADNHIRMIKTGESGMTVFRLLTKNGGWVWVQANARLVYKAGRPDFIIARQRALVNAEGEEHLRQRSLRLPFSFTTGEAMLYDTSPTLDLSHTHSTNRVDQKPSVPNSLLLPMQTQDKTIHQQNTKPQFSPDEAFADSWALFNVPNCTAQVKSTSGEDTNESVFNALEQLAQDGDLYTALQQMDTGALNEWETAILRMTKDNNGNDRFLSLDEILTNDIFSYVEEALNKENCEAMVQPGCEFISTGAENNELQADRKSIGHLDRKFRTDDTMENNVSWCTAVSSQTFVNNSPVVEKTSQFTCANEVTQSSVGSTSNLENTESYCQFTSNSAISTKNPQMSPSPNHIHKLTQNLWNRTSTENQKAPMFPSTKTCVSSSMTLPSLSKFPQSNETRTWWNASSEQPCASLAKNRLSSECCYQASAISSSFLPESSQSCNDKHVNFVSSMYQSPGNGFTVNKLSSCMFKNHPPLHTSADRQHSQAHGVAISSCANSKLPFNQSPPQASCYFQWTPREPLVGTSSIPQEDTCISPPSCQTGPGIIAPLDGHGVFQRYLGCNNHI